jgi:predicted DNA-binding transcriptional regulator AlpA
VREKHPIFVSIPRFAEMVGLSERTIWKFISENRLQPTRIGRRTLIRVQHGVESLERLGTSRTRRPR